MGIPPPVISPSLFFHPEQITKISDDMQSIELYLGPGVRDNTEYPATLDRWCEAMRRKFEFTKLIMEIGEEQPFDDCWELLREVVAEIHERAILGMGFALAAAIAVRNDDDAGRRYNGQKAINVAEGIRTSIQGTGGFAGERIDSAGASSWKFDPAATA